MGCADAIEWGLSKERKLYHTHVVYRSRAWVQATVTAMEPSRSFVCIQVA